MSRRKAAWKNPERRMRRAVELRREGQSLRQIADRLAVHHRTIERDLQRFETENVDQLLSHLSVAYDLSNPVMRQQDATGEEER